MVDGVGAYSEVFLQFHSLALVAKILHTAGCILMLSP